MGEMQAKSDAQLLREYAERGSEPAFAELVTRYTDLVYSAALRQVENPDLARDVAQSVFTDLARKASHLGGSLAQDVSLVGWLYCATRFAGRTSRRTEHRRQSRERQAMDNVTPGLDTAPDWEAIRPLLDEAMEQLSEPDRDALLLRFFKNHDLRAVGVALSISDDAAQKRVSRAVERLREFLAKRGVAVGASGLAVVLSAHAVQAAPAGMAVALSATALSGTAVGTSTALAITKTLAMTTLQKTLVTAAAAAALATSVFVQHRHHSRMRELDHTFQQQGERTARLRAENSRLSNLLAQADAPNRLQELEGLRTETARLRTATNDLARLQEENRGLRKSKSRAPVDAKNALELKDEAIAKLNSSKDWMLAFHLFADKNQEQFPTRLDQAAGFLPDRAKEDALGLADKFEIMYQGSRDGLTNPMNTLVIREKQAWQSAKGNWLRTYGFADGHSELHSSPDGRFEAWESERLVAPTRP
jgi:RNA polymerase sigma factor (sigma-70 family)